MQKTKSNVLSIRHFLWKLSRNLLMGVAIIALCLGAGMMGYHHFENMSWVDAYVNAAMILSGMGPISPLLTESGKIFAGSYALFSGIVFLFVIALILAPLVHRFLHKFHMEDEIRKQRQSHQKGNHNQDVDP